MKTYQQMAVEVLKARDAHLLKKQRRKVLLRIYVPIAASFSFSVLIGLHFWQDRQKLPEIQHIPEMTLESTEAETTYSMFLPSETNLHTSTALTTETASDPEEVDSTVMAESEMIHETEPTESIWILETEVQRESILIQETVLIPEEQTVPETEETEPPAMVFPTERTPEPSAETEPADTPSNGDQLTDGDNHVTVVTPPLQEIVLHFASNSIDDDTLTEEEVVFRSTGYTIQEDLVSYWFDTVDVIISYPDGSQKFIEHLGDAYHIENIPSEMMAAVQFSGDEHYYLFCNEELGEEEFRTELAASGILQ